MNYGQILKPYDISHCINKLTDISSILFNSGGNFHVIHFAESGLSIHVSDSDVWMPGYSIMSDSDVWMPGYSIMSDSDV